MSKTLSLHASMTPPSRELTRFDVAKRDRGYGMAGIGCHLILKRDGTLIETGRDRSAGCAYDTPTTRGTVGLLLVGGADASGQPVDNFTSTQRNAILRLLESGYDKVRVQVPAFPDDLITTLRCLVEVEVVD